ARGAGRVAGGSTCAGAGNVRPVAGRPGDGRRRAGGGGGGGEGGGLMQRVAVIVFPGSNCDAETIAAARQAGSDAYRVWHRDADLKRPDVVVPPGGFSYGDYLRAGAIARFPP